jgi:hypothetical protein
LNGGLKMREGYNRIATNNIIVNNGLHPHVWYPNSGDIFKNNIVFKSYKPAIMDRAIARDGQWGKILDFNFYVATKDVMNHFAGNGCDKNSINGDPRFVDPAKGDFRVMENSPALKLGFVNFPMYQFGVTKPSLKAIAKTPEIPEIFIKINEEKEQVSKPIYIWMGMLLKEPVGNEFSAFGVGFDSGGLILTTVPENSEATKLGFRNGDLLLEINGFPIKGIQQLKEYFGSPMNSNKKHVFKVVRNQVGLEISLKRKLPEIRTESSSQ